MNTALRSLSVCVHVCLQLPHHISGAISLPTVTYLMQNKKIYH